MVKFLCARGDSQDNMLPTRTMYIPVPSLVKASNPVWKMILRYSLDANLIMVVVYSTTPNHGDSESVRLH